MRIIYLGTPAFAVLPLERLARDPRYQVVGVVTQPDRPVGRSTTPTPPPVKECALALGIPVLQPATLRDPQAVEQLAALQPDVGVVAAYGEILRKRVLALPPLGYVNLHPSLLPLHRGPTPVAGAILAGDTETGVSLIRLTAKMDAGPLLAQQRVPLPADARAGSLTTELFALGSELLAGTLAAYAAGQIALQPQDDEAASYTRLLSRADGEIDWQLPAVQIERMLRAYDPWPGSYTSWHGQPFKIGAARPLPDLPSDSPPGSLLDHQPELRVATGAGVLELITVQPAGKRAMPATEWRRGQRDLAGQRLGLRLEA